MLVICTRRVYFNMSVFISFTKAWPTFLWMKRIKYYIKYMSHGKYSWIHPAHKKTNCWGLQSMSFWKFIPYFKELLFWQLETMTILFYELNPYINTENVYNKFENGYFFRKSGNRANICCKTNSILFAIMKSETLQISRPPMQFVLLGNMRQRNCKKCFSSE